MVITVSFRECCIPWKGPGTHSHEVLSGRACTQPVSATSQCRPVTGKIDAYPRLPSSHIETSPLGIAGHWALTIYGGPQL